MPDPNSIDPTTASLLEKARNEMQAEAAKNAAPPPEHIYQFFAYDHLPAFLQEVSKPFSDLADVIVSTLPRNPERTVALRKLLESKDAAVRARLAK